MSQTVHVFLSPHHWSVEETNTRLCLLPLADQMRSERYSHPARLQSFVASRWLLRHALSSIAPLAAHEWRFNYEKRLVIDNTQTTWHTSLSHSDNWVACVLALTPQCGIDIEQRIAKPRFMAIAQRFFHVEEYQLLLAESEYTRFDLFLDLWTRKEACVKAWHRGLAHHLASVRFRQQPLSPCSYPAEYSHLPLTLQHWRSDDWQLAAAVNLIKPDWQLHHLKL